MGEISRAIRWEPAGLKAAGVRPRKSLEDAGLIFGSSPLVLHILIETLSVDDKDCSISPSQAKPKWYGPTRE